MKALVQAMVNAMMPETDVAWLAGIKANEEGQLRDTCPYTDPELVNQWQQGFNVASVLNRKERVLHV